MNIIKIGHDGCGPCLMVAQKLKAKGIAFAEKTPDEVPELIEKYNVRGVPCLVITEDDGSEKFLRNVQEINQWLVHQG